MKGTIFEAFKETIIKNFSEKKWNEIFEKSSFDKEFPILRTENYDDNLFFDIFKIALEHLKLNEEELFALFADYFFLEYLPKQYVYIIQSVSNSEELFEQLDDIHVYLSKASDLKNVPRFKYQKLTETSSILEYKSNRNLFVLFLKILEAVRKKFKDFDYEVLADNKVKINYFK